MDVHMPQMDGLEATRRIVAGEAGKAGETGRPRIVAMTASALRATARLAWPPAWTTT